MGGMWIVLARPLVAFHQEVLHQVAWQSQKVVEYHSEGEFLPEKFQFDARSEFYIDGMVPKRHENLDDLDSTDGDTDDDRDTCLDDRAEAESRRLDAMTLDAINCPDPFKMVTIAAPRCHLDIIEMSMTFRLSFGSAAMHVIQNVDDTCSFWITCVAVELLDLRHYMTC